MKTLRAAMTISLVTLATAALALPTFVKDFESNYKIKKDSTLNKASCAVCHVGKTAKLNAYGEDLKKAMAAAKTKKLTGDVLKKVEDLDSDKDGVKNGAEIKANTLPGDSKSK